MNKATSSGLLGRLSDYALGPLYERDPDFAHKMGTLIFIGDMLKQTKFAAAVHNDMHKAEVALRSKLNGKFDLPLSATPADKMEERLREFESSVAGFSGYATDLRSYAIKHDVHEQCVQTILNAMAGLATMHRARDAKDICVFPFIALMRADLRDLMNRVREGSAQRLLAERDRVRRRIDAASRQASSAPGQGQGGSLEGLVAAKAEFDRVQRWLERDMDDADDVSTALLVACVLIAILAGLVAIPMGQYLVLPFWEGWTRADQIEMPPVFANMLLVSLTMMLLAYGGLVIASHAPVFSLLVGMVGVVLASQFFVFAALLSGVDLNALPFVWTMALCGWFLLERHAHRRVKLAAGIACAVFAHWMIAGSLPGQFLLDAVMRLFAEGAWSRAYSALLGSLLFAALCLIIGAVLRDFATTASARIPAIMTAAYALNFFALIIWSVIFYLIVVMLIRALVNRLLGKAEGAA